MPTETSQAIEIITDHKWHQLRYRYEVPIGVLNNQFTHLHDDIDGFFKYRGYWYHVSDFSAFVGLGASPFDNWDGYTSDSYFSGVVIKMHRDGETYMIGRYYS